MNSSQPDVGRAAFWNSVFNNLTVYAPPTNVPWRLPSKPEPEPETVPGFLRGYRIWAVRVGGTLRAAISSATWAPGVNTAECLRDSGLSAVNRQLLHHTSVPAPSCSCGFYAHHRIEPDLMQYADDFYSHIVIGSIRAWGNIILGTKGFRAQYAQVESITGYSGLIVGAVARTYQVPAFRNVGDLVKKFPPISVDNLLPPEPHRRLSAECVRPGCSCSEVPWSWK